MFKTLVYCDYPDKWPGLLEALCGHLASQVTQWMQPGSCLFTAADCAPRAALPEPAATSISAFGLWALSL